AAVVVGDLADEVQLPVLEAAYGAYTIAVHNMTKAVRAVTSERGRDPRGAALIAFGGAGPMFAADVARVLGIAGVVIPVHPGLFSSVGLIVADMVREEVTPSGGAGRIEEQFRELEARAMRGLAADGASATDVTVERIVDARYRGQRHALRVPVPDG